MRFKLIVVLAALCAVCAAQMSLPATVTGDGPLSMGEHQPVVGSSREHLATMKWPRFIRRFRAALRQRDKVALRSMMIPDFLFTGKLHEDAPPDIRVHSLSLLDESHGRSWHHLDRILRHGTRYSRDRAPTEGFDFIRFAPPWATEPGYVDEAASFEFGPEGEWYWTGYFLWDC